MFAEYFPKNSNLDDSIIASPVFPTRTNLKLHRISVTPNLVKKVIMNIDFFWDWQVSSVVPIFKNVRERSTAKNHRPVSLLSMVSKVFEKLVNNRIVDHVEKCDLFSDFQCSFRSSWLTAGFLTVVSDRIARAFNRSGATRALDISKAFDRDCHAGLLHKRKCYRISGQMFDLISSFLSNGRLQVVLDGNCSQE